MYEVNIEINPQDIMMKFILGDKAFSAFWQLQDNGIFTHIPDKNGGFPLIYTKNISIELNNTFDQARYGISIVTDCIARQYTDIRQGKRIIKNQKPSVKLILNPYGWTTFLLSGKHTLIERWEVKNLHCNCITPFKENMVVFPLYLALSELTPYLLEIVFQLQQTAFKLIDKHYK